MDRFRALLLGVSDYEAYGLPPLPFVPDDIAGLATALENAGYLVEAAQSGALSRGTVLTRVASFLNSSRRGDTLLIYLSGHGAHTNGRDYLVPADADTSFTPIADVLVPITYWASKIDECNAAQVLFLIDACREGVQDSSMGLSGNRRWSTGKIDQVSGRKVAYLFSCGPGQLSRFLTVAGETFSIFCRALREAVAGGVSGQTLEDLVRAIDALIRDTTSRHGLPEQAVRVLGDGHPHAEFQFLPSGRRDGDGTGRWLDQAGDHRAWQFVVDDQLREPVRDATVRLVGHLWRSRRQAANRLADDPWHDPEFGFRMAQRVEFLLTRVFHAPTSDAGRTPNPSAAEAALLVVGPYLYDAFWALRLAEAAAADPADWSDRAGSGPQRADFRRFLRGYPRLSRRVAARSHDPLIGGQVGWWLLHRWARRLLPLQRGEALVPLIPPDVSAGSPAALVFEPNRLAELLRCVRSGPAPPSQGERPDGLVALRPIAAGTGWEQQIRERLVAYLLSLGHRMAIEADQLPDVLVEHVGIADPVLPQEVHAAIRSAEWVPRGAARVLRTSCSHPALEIALRTHTQALDDLLTDAREAAEADPSTAPLAALPHHVNAEQVSPAVTPAGHSAYQSAGVRFHLAEDRVQELLMGEQLYGDTGLAIRELYQNALDACRYRKARAAYLERTGRAVSAWEGRITFTEGVDREGRAYLECADNGIGMGQRELQAVFSQAGTRFVDTPEFLEEQSRWERLDPPIRLYPNSRFGIGVLSYFMLADEISIATRRFDRDGGTGPALRVSIAGPGNLFRIQPSDEPATPGTVVRLYLRPDANPPSCPDLLRRLLWVAEFHTRVVLDETNYGEWLPDTLSAAAPLGTDDALGAPSVRPTSVDDTPLSRSPGQPVWWCDADGAILVDGIWLARGPFGAVVNLREEHAPRLSVNRTRILDDPTAHVDELLRDALPAIAAPGNPVLRHAWLCRLAQSRPALADLILDAAIESGWRSWPEEDGTEGLLVAGCFPPDEHTGVLPPARWLARSPARLTTVGAGEWPPFGRFTADSFRPLANWRLAAWTAAGAYPDQTPLPRSRIVRARPTDAVLLARDLNGHRAPESTASYASWLDPRHPVTAGRVLATGAELGWTAERVRQRLRELGFTVPTGPLPETPLVKTDQVLISYGANSKLNWLDPDKRLSAGHIIAAAARLGWTTTRVTARLRELNYPVPNRALPDLPATEIDRLLASRRVDGGPPWLDLDNPPPPEHVVLAMATTGWTGQQVADRLRRWGFVPLDDIRLELGPLGAEDRLLISRSLDGKAPWLEPELRFPGGRQVSLGHLIGATAALGWTGSRVVGRLRELGFPVPDWEVSGVAVTDIDRKLASNDNGGNWPWLPSTRPVPLGRLLAAATKLPWDVRRVAARLAELGFPVSAKSLPNQPLAESDLVLLRCFFGGHWHRSDAAVELADIIDTAIGARWEVGDVAERLRQLGFSVPADLPEGSVTETDRRLFSTAFDGRPPWLRSDRPVPVKHILDTSAKVNWTPAQTADRLRQLGYTVSDQRYSTQLLTETDLRLIRVINTVVAWDPDDRPVNLSEVTAAATESGWDRMMVANRLRELGCRVDVELTTEGSVGLGTPGE